MTRLEAMEELTLLLNKTRATRKFGQDMWGEESATELYDQEIALFEFLLQNLQDSPMVAAIMEGEIIHEGVEAK